MKLKIERNILLENLNNVSKALSARNIIPVLNGIKFELTKEGLSLIATDNDITIKTLIDKKNIIELEEHGEVIIYGRLLLDLIRKIPNTTLNIEKIDGNKIIITTDTSNYNLNCYEIADFPNIKIETTKTPIKITTGDLKELINQTIFATSTQESRPLLTGINFKIIGNILECIATDSYRLAKSSINLSTSLEENINIVIPAANISELIKILDDEETEIEIHIFSNKIVFKYKNLLFQSSLLNGSYPNTDNLIPKDYEFEIKVNLNDYFNVIDRASLLTQAKEKNIIQMNVTNKKINITSSSLEIGKIEENLIPLDYKGENTKISFSSKYMLDALKTFKTDDIYILLNGEVKPIILKSEKNNNLIQLILPIKTY